MLSARRNARFQRQVNFFKLKNYMRSNKSANVNASDENEVLAKEMSCSAKARRLKICLLVVEYFGAMGTSWGGYGFLARHIVAKLISKYSEIDIEVCLGKRQDRKFSFARYMFSKEEFVDGVRVFRLPRSRFFARRFLKRRKFDAFLSIEEAGDYALQCGERGIPWIFWIQDPRPWYEWREIRSVSIAPEPVYWDQKVYDEVNEHYRGRGRREIRFITQAVSLNEKAMDLYRLWDDVKIDFVPNPVEIPEVNTDEILEKKENKIIFLGRLDDVKRVWIFCEIAKAIPEYEFVVVGKTLKKESLHAIEKYRSGISNLKFTGHLDGAEKFEQLSRAKILVNTSIHEALPVSFVEALAVGTLIVSNQNPDHLAERFGRWIGRVSGDGFEAVSKFVAAVRDVIRDDARRDRTAREAMQYVLQTHAPEVVFPRLEKIIRETID